MGHLYRRLFDRDTTEHNLRPALIFFLLSIFFGVAISIMTPPLRGPDESAHFLRAYGIARGDIVPSIRDQESRKGIFLPTSTMVSPTSTPCNRRPVGRISVTEARLTNIGSRERERLRTILPRSFSSAMRARRATAPLPTCRTSRLPA
jgi:hypothetical protein